MKTEFKENDLVYNPRKGISIYRVGVNTEHDSDLYPLAIVYDPELSDFDSFTRDGKVFANSELPVLFKATEENCEMLSKLYGVEFEAPPAKLTPKEIIEALIDKNGFLLVRHVRCCGRQRAYLQCGLFGKNRSGT